MSIDRRRFVGSAAGMAAITGVAADWFWPKHSVSYQKPRSFVAILNAADYSEKVEALLMDGLRLFRLNVAGRRVLLKPNLVEDLPGPVNTNADIIGAAARCFLRLGAARVVIGEGPGHQRDTELVVQAANLKPHLADRQIQFVDLNRDELVRVKLKANYSGLGGLWLPRTVLDSDFVVSMPKIKTHHWAGVTLSLKNMFGIVPGMKYGWPKNLLHWHGIHPATCLSPTFGIRIIRLLWWKLAPNCERLTGRAPGGLWPTIIGTSAELSSPLRAINSPPKQVVNVGDLARSSSPFLDKFTSNLTDSACRKQIDPVLGRDSEINQVIDIPLRRRQANLTSLLATLGLVRQRSPKASLNVSPAAMSRGGYGMFSCAHWIWGLLQAGASAKGQSLKSG